MPRGHRFQEAEVAGVLRALPGDAVDDLRDAPRHAVTMRLGFAEAHILGHLDRDAGDAGAGEAVGIGAAPELAVGDDLQPDVLLQLDDVADRVVLDRGQPFAVELAGGVLLPRAQQFRRAQQAADMLGAERRIHGTNSCIDIRRNSCAAEDRLGTVRQPATAVKRVPMV